MSLPRHLSNRSIYTEACRLWLPPSSRRGTSHVSFRLLSVVPVDETPREDQLEQRANRRAA